MVGRFAAVIGRPDVERPGIGPSRWPVLKDLGEPGELGFLV